MKAINLILVMLCSLIAQAQVKNYTFMKETGQPMDITAYPGIVITHHVVADDDVLPAKIATGFPFMFNGTLYDSVWINENGYIWFGTEDAQAMSTVTKPISAPLSALVKGIVCAYGEDLHPHVNTGLTTTIKSGTYGTSPMRELIIEWKNTSRFASLNAGMEDSLTFQIKLYEFMNRIEIAYGYTGLNTTTATQVEVGLRGPQANDFNNRMTDATHNWKNSLAGTDNAKTCELKKNVQPEYGDMYVWMNLNQNPDPTGVNEPNKNTQVVVYPNPSAGNVVFETTNGEEFTVKIANVMGQQLLVAQSTGHTYQLNDNYENGVYLYTLINRQGATIANGRFVISK